MIEAALERGAEQDPDELEAIVQWWQGKTPPESVLEIGVRRGGLLALWQMLWPEARVYGVDINLPPCPFCERRVAHSYCPRYPRNGRTFVGNSRSSRTIDAVRRAVQSVDFLYIDGDHSLAGVRSDFLNYSPLLVSGGLVAFHDAANEDCPDVGDYIKDTFDPAHVTTVVGNRGGMGTALVYGLVFL